MIRSRIQPVGMVALIPFTFFTAILLAPRETLAQQAVSTESDAIESSQEEEDVDPNLVPLEPELTITPSDLASSGDRPNIDGEPAEISPSIEAVAPFIQAAEPSANITESSATAYNIPVIIDSNVQSHIRFFNTSIRSRFEQWLVRLSRYRPLVEDIFAEFDLPSDLVHLSLVESGFNPYAYSRARATGPWQFMKGTGKLYGLRIDHYVDERRDPIKSTVAAAKYLRDLYDLFGTWPLAMAAYNAGEGKVMRALRKARAESFSEISKTKLIRRETREYVPRIMAATIIARNRDHYGFGQDSVPPHEFEEVPVTRPLHFRAIAKVTGVSYDELRALNPELRRNMTPPGGSTYLLKVPVGASNTIVQSLDKVPTHKVQRFRGKQKFVKKGDSSRWYRVRAGDTLGKIAKRFRMPLKTLKTRNNLSSHIIRPGEFLIIGR